MTSSITRRILPHGISLVTIFIALAVGYAQCEGFVLGMLNL